MSHTVELLSRNIAVSFRQHLIAELSKDESVQLRSSFDGRSGREINEELLRKTEAAFPEIEREPLPEVNLFEEWTQRNQFLYRYNEYIFEAYNIIFFERLMALRAHNDSARQQFMKTTLEVFSRFPYRQEGFSVSFFLRVENNMREILREKAAQIPGINQKEAWEIIFEQSKDYQEAVNEFFERILTEEKERSDALLKNILPEDVAEELKRTNRTEPVYIPSATVLFTDFKGFTALSEKIPPVDLIRELDRCFTVLDSVIDKYRIEKIKTIGDSYMCAGGVPAANSTHAEDAARAALEMRDRFAELAAEKKARGEPYWDIRIGFHTGPLVAGVIGKKKFSYDIWGDTVNTASRMESASEPGRINVSGASYLLLKDRFRFETRGRMPVKGKGEMEMFFLEGLI